MSGLPEERGGKPAYIQKRDEAARAERKRQEHKESVAAINAVADELAADQQKNDTNESRRGLREKVTIGLLVGTVIAAGLGDWIFYHTMKDSRLSSSNQIEAMRKQLTVMQDQLEEARIDQRAWIAPLNASLTRPLDPASDIVSITVSAQNTGREPALDIISMATIDAAPQDKIEDRRACDRTFPQAGEAAVYPSDHFGMTLNYATQFATRPQIVRDIIAGRQILFIMGCFAYRTMGQPHHSGYCFYLYPQIGPQTGDISPKPVAEWVFRKCPVGNIAD